MIKKIVLYAVLIISLFIGYKNVSYAAEPQEWIMDTQAERLETKQVEVYWQELMRDYGGFFPEGHTPSFQDLFLPGRDRFSLSGVMQGLLKFMFHEVLYNGKLLVTIVMLSIFTMLLETIQSAFERNTVSRVAYAMSIVVLIIISINSFSVAIGYASAAISGMIHFMIAVIPLLLTLLASMGNMATVTFMHPMLIFMIYSIGTLVHIVVLPLLFFSAVLHIVSALSDRYKVTQLADLLRNVSVGLLGVLVTIFLGVVSVQGATAAVTDGIAIRTAKYVAGNFVPVVGRIFTDASETVIGASLLLKNAVGLAGVLIVIFMCAFPALKILALALIYNIASAVIQPLGRSPMAACLQTIGKSLLYVFVCLAVVGFIFFLAITILISAGNISVMMR